MVLGSRVSRARCAVVWAAASVTVVLLTRMLRAPVAEGLAAFQHGALGSAGFASVLVWGCAAVGLAVSWWLWWVTTVVVADAWRGVTSSRRGVPVVVRHAALLLCGVALTALPAPAVAVGGGPPAETPRVLSGLRLPERAAVPLLPRAHSTPQPSATEPPMVEVEPGDTLWSLAAEQLGPGATDAETARAWPVIYALNRDVIGTDPSRIQPGQRLVLPAGGLEGSSR